MTVSLLVLGLLLTCENLCPSDLLCVILGPGWGKPWFPHSAVLLFLTCLSYDDLCCVLFCCFVFFLTIPIYLMMHKSLSPNRAGRLNLHRAACGSCVFGWFLVYLCV